MDKYNYELNHDLIKFLNVFSTQMRIPNKIRNLIIAVIALCEHSVTATISIDSLQELLSNLSKNPTQKRISRTQLELLFTDLRRQEYQLATCLIWYQFCSDDSTILVRLDIMSSYDDVMQYAQNLATFDTNRTRAIHDAVVKLFIPFELPLSAKTRQKTTFEALGKKLGKITDLLSSFVDTGVDEKINFDDIRRQLAEVMDSISTKGLVLAKRLDALELQQQQEQQQMLNKIENQLEVQIETQNQELTSTEVKEVKEVGQQIVCSRNGNANNNSKLLDSNNNSDSSSSSSSKMLTTHTSKQTNNGYIRDLEVEAKNRTLNSINTINSIYNNAKNRGMRNSVNSGSSHYT